jgi:hypothetical protein
LPCRHGLAHGLRGNAWRDANRKSGEHAVKERKRQYHRNACMFEARSHDYRLQLITVLAWESGLVLLSLRFAQHDFFSDFFY